MFTKPEAVIGKDLKFSGQQVKIVGQGKIKVDCEFEGDVIGNEVVISERGKVKGNVAGERVIILGQIVGDISGDAITLVSTAHVKGDIQHKSLTIETGAEFAGRSRLRDEGGLSTLAPK